MKKKNNSLVIILVIVIVILSILCVLFATDVISFNKDKDKESDNTNVYNYDMVYKDIIDEYKKAMEDDIDNIGNYKYVNINLMISYFNDSSDIEYTYYDINGDNIKELVISKNLVDIFSYDGTKVFRLFEDKSGCLGNRCSLDIYDDGIIHYSGSGGAAYHYDSFYKINDKTSTLNTLNDYYEIYEDENTVHIYDNSTYDENKTNKELNFKTVDDAVKSNIGNAKLLDVNTLEWYTIK